MSAPIEPTTGPTPRVDLGNEHGVLRCACCDRQQAISRQADGPYLRIEEAMLVGWKVDVVGRWYCPYHSPLDPIGSEVADVDVAPASARRWWRRLLRVLMFGKK